jgi:hypothetical protein
MPISPGSPPKWWTVARRKVSVNYALVRIVPPADVVAYGDGGSDLVA